MGFLRYNQHRTPRHQRFKNLPRHKRADQRFKMKHAIIDGEYDNFYSYDYLDEGVSWCDLYFLGKDKATFYNATFITASDDLKGQRQSYSWNTAYNMLSEEEREIEFHWDWKPIGNGMSEMIFPKTKPTYEQFGGLTYRDYCAKLKAEKTDFVVYEKVELDFGYAHGIGLHATLDVPLLVPEVISDFVRRFLETEKPWKSTTPAKFIDSPVYDSNALKIKGTCDE